MAISLLASPSARAQTAIGPEEGDNPVSYNGATNWGDFLFRAQFHTKGYGEGSGKGVLGLNRTQLFDGFALFGDAAFRVDDYSRPSPSLGGGLRFQYANWLGDGAQRIGGVHAWYDGNSITNEDHSGTYFQQFGVGLESLGELWDFRLNANFPIGKKQYEGGKVSVGDSYFLEHWLATDYRQYTESAMTQVDVEAARRIGNRNLWAFAGAYYLNGNDEDTLGGKAGLRGYLTQDVAASVTVSNDKLFNTVAMFSVTWFLDNTNRRAEMAPVCLDQRWREPVQRTDYVVVHSRWERGVGDVMTDPEGNVLYFVHASGTASSGGDGTYEHPYSTLAAAQAGSSEGDYVFLHANSVFNNQSITLQESQKLLGDGVAHTVLTQYGTKTLPMQTGTSPIIQNSTGYAITLADDTEVSGVTISGGQGGITGSSLTSVAIDRVTVGSTTGYGVNLQDSSGTVTIDQFAYSGGTVGAGGVQFSNYTGGATVTHSTITGGSGTGVAIASSDGSFSITSSSLSNTGGAALSVDGGSANVAFTGTITQANTGAALSVSGGHAGVISLAPTNTGDNVITATGGTGLVFNNADGIYTIGQTRLTGGSAGVSITNSSDGTFDFSACTITSPQAVAFNLSGGSANVAFTGKITQANPYAAVAIGGGHTGTVTFTSTGTATDVITATGGTGLVANNADGVYTFGQTHLTGGSAGVSITNDSDGAFTFSACTITSPKAVAFNLSGGSANVAFTGSISQANDYAAVAIGGNHTGTVTFATSGTDTVDAITATGGTGLVFNGADGVYTFGQTHLTGGSAGVSMTNSDGTFTLSACTITSPKAVAFNLSGGSANVAFTGSISQANDYAAVAIGGNHTGTVTFATSGTDTVDAITATGGTGLVFNGADGVYNFGRTHLTGGSAGISMTNSDGTFTLSACTITSPKAVAFNLSGGSANVAFTGSISQANDYAAVAIGGNHTGTVTFTAGSTGTNVITATDGTGLVFDGADGKYSFGRTTLSGGSASLRMTDSDGNFTFSACTITSPDAVAFNLSGGSATVAYTGKITQANDYAAVAISGNHTGTVTFTAGSTGVDAITATDGTGLVFDGADGKYSFARTTLSGGSASIRMTDSDGKFTFSACTITSPDAVALNISGGSATVAYAGNITQANDYQTVAIQNMTGGSVTITAPVIGTAQGISVLNNTNSVVAFTGNVDLDTDANDAVAIAGNTGSKVSFTGGLAIKTSSGDGFSATNGGTITVSGTSNTLDTGTGSGLTLTDVAVGSSGVTFASVVVDGAANGVLLDNVTGGSVSISSGTISNTTGAAVSLTNAANVSLTNVAISNAGGNGVTIAHDDANAMTVSVTDTTISNSGGNGVAVSSMGSGTMTVTLGTNTITGGSGTDSIAVAIGDSSSKTYLTITDNTVNNSAGDYAALAMNVSGTTSTKTVTTLIDNNTFFNESDTVTTVTMTNSALGTLNATVTGNTFNNGGAGTECLIQSNANAAVVFLELENNAAGGGTGVYNLTNSYGTFKVYDLETVSGTATTNSGVTNLNPDKTKFSNSATEPPTP
ncbi:MAG: right-handed parallel beta-helix repeat-containing protein [Thermoguttaceae bacterium]